MREKLSADTNLRAHLNWVKEPRGTKADGIEPGTQRFDPIQAAATERMEEVREKIDKKRGELRRVREDLCRSDGRTDKRIVPPGEPGYERL